MPTPDAYAPWLAWLSLPFVLVVGFFLPGYLSLRVWPCAVPWAGAFVGSVLLQFSLVFFFHVTGIPITLVTLSGGLGLIALGGWWYAGQPAPTLKCPAWPIDCNLMREWWWLLPCVAALASVVTRTLIDPLSGWDNVFRWNHLALLIRAQESLNAYPAVSAADFRIYPWCDGIPPALAITNLWVYLGTGSTYGGLISGRVLVEFALTYALVWHLAGKLWGRVGSRFAVLLLSTSSLFLWSLANSQETGLSGVALLAMATFAVHYRETPRLDTAIWLMLSAGLAALTRDYNLLFLPVAALILIAAKTSRAHLLSAIAVGMVVVSPWYIRNAWLTGNPLYAETLGGLLPGNIYHQEFMHAVRAHWALLAQTDRWGYLAMIVLISAGIVLLPGAIGLVRHDSRLTVLRWLSGTAVVLWLLSVASTAGGWAYSLRVLGPALPLLSVAGSGIMAQRPTRRFAMLGLVLLPFSFDAARRSWLLPLNFTVPAWPYSWQLWRDSTANLSNMAYPQIWQALAVTAGHEGIVVDHPLNVIRGGQAGGLMVPLTSPEAATLTSAHANSEFTSLRRSLRAQHFRYIVLTIDTPMNVQLLKRWPALRTLLTQPPTVQLGGMLIYDLALSDDEPPPRRRLITGP